MRNRADWADNTITVTLDCMRYPYTLCERFGGREKLSRFWRRSPALEAYESAWQNVERLLTELELVELKLGE